MKTILHTTISPCDNERRIFHEVETASGAGYRVFILALKTPDLPARELKGGVPIHRLPIPVWKGGPFKFLLFNLKLFFKLFGTTFDLLHCHDLWVLPASALAARLKGKKLVYDAHEYYAGLEIFQHKRCSRVLWLQVQRWLMPLVDALIAVNPEQLARYQEDFPRLRRCRVLFNFPRCRSGGSTRTPGFQDRENVVLFQGIFKPGRGLFSLLTAFEGMDETIHLWLIGFGELEDRLKQRFRSHPRRSQIHFLGKLPLPSIGRFTRRARVGVVLFEPTSINYRLAAPNKFFEYVSAGTPIVASRIPTFEALNQQFEVALLVDPNKPEEISRAIRILLQQPDVWHRLHQQCLKARTVWCWEQQEDRLLSLYNDLISGTP